LDLACGNLSILSPNDADTLEEIKRINTNIPLYPGKLAEPDRLVNRSKLHRKIAPILALGIAVQLMDNNWLEQKPELIY
jgi:hypothetical protein